MGIDQGVYLITNAGSGTAATLKDGYVKGWERIKGKEQLNQLWFVKSVKTSASDPGYAAFNLATNKVLDLEKGLADRGTPILGWDYHEGDNQHWVIKKQADGKYYKIQSVKTQTFVDLNNGGKDNGTKIQGWVGSWDETNSHQRWVFNQFSATGSRIKSILDTHPKIHGKVIVEWPDRIYFTPDQYIFEAIWAKTGLADIKPRDPLFQSEAYEKVFKGWVVSRAQEIIKVDGFDILVGSLSLVEKSTQKIKVLDVSVRTSDDKSPDLSQIVFFDPESGRTLVDIPEGYEVNSVII
ncbi:ricin B-like lectin [Schizophyllum commune H4-8]|nr:ricin B-like lectin [Schizophyllum commune H4-8]KAI5891366.1 ricin B-like lectin [Schizophyllum commune H4-8]